MLIAALDAILAMPVLTPMLARLEMSALTVVGERDEPILELAAVYERIMSNCRAVVVPGCHHYPMTDRPTAFAECVLPSLKGAQPDAWERQC
jgi:pimeloyl-ACP methyl ester carboxylesterase